MGCRSDGGGRSDGSARLGRLHVALIAATVGMVSLAACSGEGEATASGETDVGRITCEHADGYAVTYPADWQTYGNEENPDLAHLGCRIFGTAELEVVEAATSLPWVPIGVKVEDGVSFQDVTRPELGSGDEVFPRRVVESTDTTVAGRPALRVVSVSEAPEDAPPNDYSLSGGTEMVSWYVDLATATTDRVLIAQAIPLASASTGVTDDDKTADGATSVSSTAEVLDAMMASLTLAE